MKAFPALIAALALWGLQACAHEFVVATDPPGATVSIDGVTVGPTPAALSADTLAGAAKNGYLTIKIKKNGYDTLNLALPAAPASDRISIALKPFRDAAAKKAESSVTPLRWNELERDLSELMRQQGRLILGETVPPLDLARWRKTYPESGAAAFLEALRLYEAGQKPESLALLAEAMRRNDREIDYRVVASAVESGAEAGE